MTLFKSDQFIIIPTMGFVREGETISLTFAWLMYGVSLSLFEIRKERE